MTGKTPSLFVQLLRMSLLILVVLAIAALLGITLEGDTVRVPYFGQILRLTADGLTDEAGQRPDFSDCVVVCRYLIMCPPFAPKQTPLWPWETASSLAKVARFSR